MKFPICGEKCSKPPTSIGWQSHILSHQRVKEVRHLSVGIGFFVYLENEVWDRKDGLLKGKSTGKQVLTANISGFQKHTFLWKNFETSSIFRMFSTYIYIPNGYKALNPSNPIFPQHELHSQCCGIDKFCICLKGSNKSTVGKDAPLIIRFPSLDGLTTDV